MTIHRFFQDIEASQGIIAPPEAHHMRRVLRLTPGDSVVFSDGNGTEWDCVIKSYDPDMVTITETRHIDTFSPHITLILSAIRPANIELVLEKVTELGIDTIVLTKTDFSQVPLGKLIKKQDRFEKILISATKQCERTHIPRLEIVPITEIDQFLSQQNIIGTTQYTETPTTLSSLPQTESITLCVGPEGGFSQKEYDHLSLQFIPVTFGPHVLRSETAAIAGCSVLVQQKLTFS